MEAEKRAELLREVAEHKFKAGDLIGARNTALKAQSLFTSLPGLPQMLAAYEVHIAAAATQTTGRINWHAVLGINSSADPDTIKKQLKKMRLLTHPDKNHSAAADGAFKLVEEAAASLLSKTDKGQSSSVYHPHPPSRRHHAPQAHRPHPPSRPRPRAWTPRSTPRPPPPPPPARRRKRWDKCPFCYGISVYRDWILAPKTKEALCSCL